MVDVGYQKFACMDDRIAEPSLLTPGGDLGEFLLGLNILTNSNSQNPLAIDTQGIVDMMTRYVQSLPPTRRFYHCNDDLSVSHLEKTLSLVGLDLVGILLPYATSHFDSAPDPTLRHSKRGLEAEIKGSTKSW